MRRPQFTFKTLLWLMAVVAAFCGGAKWQRERDRQEEFERLIDVTTETVQPCSEIVDDDDLKPLDVTDIVPASRAPRPFLPKR